jgi:hypothetical protein
MQTPIPAVAIEPAELTVDLGATFTVEVRVSDVSSVGGYEFEMAFDGDVVEVLDVEDGGFFEGTGRSVMALEPEIDNGAGRVIFGAVTLGDGAGARGDGRLAVLTLKGVGDGVSDLDLLDQEIQVLDTAGDKMVVGVRDGRVGVGAGSLATSTPTEAPTATAEPSTPTATEEPPTATATEEPSVEVSSTVTATGIPGQETPSPTVGPTETSAGPEETPEPTATGGRPMEGTPTATALAGDATPQATATLGATVVETPEETRAGATIVETADASVKAPVGVGTVIPTPTPTVASGSTGESGSRGGRYGSRGLLMGLAAVLGIGGLALIVGGVWRFGLQGQEEAQTSEEKGEAEAGREEHPPE